MAVSTKIQHRRDTAANWTSTNPTLADGEIGFESDTLKFKVGNGSTAWTSLKYSQDASLLTGNASITTLSTSGDANVAGKLSVTASSGDEGGEIFLSNAVTNTSITNGVTIDVYKDRLRFFEQGGSARGYYIDITAGGGGASTNLVGGSTAFNGGTITNALVVSNTGGVNTSGQFISTIATGTAPFAVSSNTMVTNLNADLLEGYSPATTSTANTVVLRDASQNFSANTVTARLYGTANLATYLVGGASGSIPYQTGANTTTFLAGATGTNSFLIYAGGMPVWMPPASSLTYLTGFASTPTAAGYTSLSNTSSFYQQFTGSTTQTVVLPNTATISTGWSFHLVNNSTANVTANTFSNTSTLLTIPAGTTAMVTCTTTANNTSAAWEFGLTDFSSYTGSSAVVMNTSPTLATPILANSTTTATAGLLDFDGTVFYSTINTTSGKSLDVASYYYVSNAQYVIDSTSASLPLSLLGASSRGITVAAGTTYEYEGLFAISASFIVTSQTPTINLISTTVSGSPVLAHQTVVESGNNATGLGSASTMSAYRFTTTGIALTALTTGNRYYIVKMRGRINVTGTGTIEVYPSIRFSAGSADNAWIVEPGSIFRMTPIGNGTVTSVGTWA